MSNSPGAGTGAGDGRGRPPASWIRRLVKLIVLRIGLRGRVSALESRCAALEAEVGALRVLVEKLEARLSGTSDPQSAEARPGGRGESGNQHVADRYRRFIERDLPQLVTELRWPPRGEALALRDICAVLFGTGEPTPDAIRRVLRKMSVSCTNEDIERISYQAVALRDDAARLGPGQRWDFGFAPGRPADPVRQEKVPGSAPDGAPQEAVEFAVAPAYVADARVIVRQKVFTTSAT